MALFFRYATIRVRDVVAQAKFWSEATGCRAVGAGDGALLRLDEDRDNPGVLLLEDHGAVPQVTGLAFCPRSGGLVGEVQRLMVLGAQIVGKVHRGFGLGEVTLADPEGNWFLVTSGPEELEAFENDESGREGCAGDPFWADAEQPPGRTGHGFTYAVVEG
ncbi:catechol 2,3-dioxygenase-like lactoylglutathione lyase family enzyme [Streptacidiphilus sp. MAP12-33]|uniref:VOC family protein n=1 Tax=Streptacidiphilus sp. MAP12-33 TaxID=3156266 RepID=UPI003515E4AC